MPNFVCDVIQWATSTKRNKVPATTLLKELPDEPGEARERMIRDFILRGDVPDYVQVWMPVPVRFGKLIGEFYCTPDFLSIGTDEDFVRVRINGATAECVGDVVGALLPTEKMVNDIYSAANRLVAQPWGAPYDHSMMLTSRWQVQDARSNEQAHARGFQPGELWAGHMKNVVIGGGLEEYKGERIGIYGWFRKDGTAIQGPQAQWRAHEWTYADYSQCIRLVHKDMLLGDTVVSVESVLQNPELALLLSNEGALKHCSYREFHPEWLS